MFAFSLCVLGVTGDWHKLSAVTFFRFLFYNDSTYFISKIIIGQWCTVTIIAICYDYLKLCMVFISWSCHARSFVPRIKLVQDILSTFKYVKISRLLDNWIIRNCRFLIICLIPCVLFSVYVLLIHSDSLSSVELSSTMIPFEFSLSVE